MTVLSESDLIERDDLYHELRDVDIVIDAVEFRGGWSMCFIRAKFFACGKRHWDSTSLTQRADGLPPRAPILKNTEVYT